MATKFVLERDHLEDLVQMGR